MGGVPGGGTVTEGTADRREVATMDRQRITAFLAQPNLALVGASRGGQGFGNVLLRELRRRGVRVLPVHPEVDSLAGERCARSLGELRGAVTGVVVVVPPERAVGVLREAAAAGIPYIWLQPGAESALALDVAATLSLEVVHGRCLLMFLEPVGFIHRVHRWLEGVRGRLPS